MFFNYVTLFLWEPDSSLFSCLPRVRSVLKEFKLNRVSDNRAVCLLFVTWDHSFLVEWCVQENNLFSLFIISIPVIAPLCCQWFIEEPFGKLGIKYSNNHLACKFPKHIHDCQNYYKNKLEEKENVFKTSDVLNSVTTSLRRPASSSGGVWHYRLTADINYQFSDSHLSIPPPPLLNRSVSNLHSH